MKRIVVVAVTIGLLVGSLAMPAEAQKKKKKKPAEPVKIERTVELPYQCPCGIDGASFVTGGGELGGNFTPSGAGEAFVKIEAADTAGQAVPGSIAQDLDGDGFTDTSAPFCGSSEAIPIEPGVEVVIYMYLTGAGCPGPATEGTMTLTFSNLP